MLPPSDNQAGLLWTSFALLSFAKYRCVVQALCKLSFLGKHKDSGLSIPGFLGIGHDQGSRIPKQQSPHKLHQVVWYHFAFIHRPGSWSKVFVSSCSRPFRVVVPESSISAAPLSFAEWLVMGAGMTTLPSRNGLMDLNWENVYHAAKTSSTMKLLRLLQDLSSQHTVGALVNAGLVPVEGAFIDIDPQVWVQHVSNAVAMKEAEDKHSRSDAWQFISELLHLSLRRYASLPFQGAVLGMSPAERKLSFSRRLALFRSLLAISGFRIMAGEARLQDTWDTCARSVTRDDTRFLCWLLVCAGANTEPDDMSAAPDVVRTAQRVIESQQLGLYIS